MAIRAELLIRIHDTGNVEVHGPINDKLASYGMLELAKDVIRAHNDQGPKPTIIPVTGALPLRTN